MNWIENYGRYSQDGTMEQLYSYKMYPIQAILGEVALLKKNIFYVTVQKQERISLYLF